VKWRGKARRSVSCHEQERQAPALNDLGDFGAGVAVNVYVQKREIELCSLCEAYSLINGPRFGDNAMAESFHDLGYHQPDKGFIFQQEYGRTICHSSSDE
jgi:hypothetical protein